MKDILAEIVENKKDIVAKAKKRMSLAAMREEIQPDDFRLAEKIKKGSWSLIAECKLQSPVKGRLCQSFSVDELAKI